MFRPFPRTGKHGRIPVCGEYQHAMYGVDGDKFERKAEIFL